MSDNTQASGTPVAEVVVPQTPAGDTPVQQPSATAVAQAAEVTDEQKKLNDKLSQQGRELKAAKERAASLEAEVASEKAKRQEMWYKSSDTPEEEKAAYRAELERQSKEGPKVAMLHNRIALSDAIADEENPVVRAALKSLRAKAEVSTKYPDADTIAALRESLTPAGDGTVQPEETPPNVTASRGTRAAAGPSIDEQIKQAEQSVKAKDGKFHYGDLLNLRQQKTMQEKAANQ